MRTERPHLPAQPSPPVSYGRGVESERIGLLTPDPADKWWRVTSTDLVEDLARDFLHDVESAGLPWLRSRDPA